MQLPKSDKTDSAREPTTSRASTSSLTYVSITLAGGPTPKLTLTSTAVGEKSVAAKMLRVFVIVFVSRWPSGFALISRTFIADARAFPDRAIEPHQSVRTHTARKPSSRDVASTESCASLVGRVDFGTLVTHRCKHDDIEAANDLFRYKLDGEIAAGTGCCGEGRTGRPTRAAYNAQHEDSAADHQAVAPVRPAAWDIQTPATRLWPAAKSTREGGFLGLVGSGRSR